MAVWMPSTPRPAYAQTLLRDAETEWFIRKISTPFFEAAGLNPDSIGIYLVQDDSINAFAFYQNIALHSGLIQKADNLNQLQGVIAHEVGHVAGGHSSRMGEGTKGPMILMLASILAGLAAAASGSGDAAAGLMIGGQSMAQRLFYSYTRVQEATADQAAMNYLEATHTSGKGLVDFFDKLRDQELLTVSRRDPYVSTHPLSGDRIQRLQDRVRESQWYNSMPSAEDEYWFKRIKAKLDGYINPPALTLRLYPPGDTSDIARYARVYAYQKALQFDAALSEADALIAESPDDPFYQEIAGQILFERGKIEQSLPYLRKASSLLPHEPLIMTSLGHALVAMETPETDAEAVDVLERSAFLDPDNDLTWRQLAVVYARQGKINMADLATAERFLLERQYPGAIQRASSAIQTFPEGSREWLEAQDIILTAQNLMADDPKYKDRR